MATLHDKYRAFRDALVTAPEYLAMPARDRAACTRFCGMVPRLESDDAVPALEVRVAYQAALDEARELIAAGRLTVDLDDGEADSPPANDTERPPPDQIEPAEAPPESSTSGSANEPEPPPTPARRYRVHPAAAIYPMMSAAELQALATSLREIGQQEPIVVSPDGEELYDGRNRLAACEIAGIEPWIVRWSGTGSVVRWIAGKNLNRRHLTDAQRAIAAGKMAVLLAEEARARSVQNLRNSPEIVDGRNPAHREDADPGPTIESEPQNPGREPAAGEDHQETSQIVDGRNSAHRGAGRSAEAAAALHGVTADAAKKAAKILQHGVESLIQAVVAGDVSLDAGALVVELPEEEQRRLVESGGVREAAKKLRREKAAARRTKPTEPESEPPEQPEPTELRDEQPDAPDSTESDEPYEDDADEAATDDEDGTSEDDDNDDEADEVAPEDDLPMVREAHEALDRVVQAARENDRLGDIATFLGSIVKVSSNVVVRLARGLPLK